EDGIRDFHVTGVQTCALPISCCLSPRRPSRHPRWASARRTGSASMASLIVWMNGERVGEWGTLRGGRKAFFRYEESWANSPRGRALSLSLPLTADREVRGPAVEYYFDNLLPDSAVIRRRIRTRFKTRSDHAVDLLTAIGRDCAGAVQLLPRNEEPKGWNRIDATPLTENEVAQTLHDVTLATPLGRAEQDDFIL